MNSQRMYLKLLEIIDDSKNDVDVNIPAYVIEFMELMLEQLKLYESKDLSINLDNLEELKSDLEDASSHLKDLAEEVTYIIKGVKN